MLSSSLISSGTKLTRLYSSNRLATEALRRRNRGPVLADKLHGRNRQTVDRHEPQSHQALAGALRVIAQTPWHSHKPSMAVTDWRHSGVVWSPQYTLRQQLMGQLCLQAAAQDDALCSVCTPHTPPHNPVSGMKPFPCC